MEQAKFHGVKVLYLGKNAIIDRIEGDRIYILKEDESIPKMLIYPDSFYRTDDRQQFLSTDSKNFLKQLKKDSVGHVCSGCGVYTEHLRKNRDCYYCENCLKNIVYCKDCKTPVKKEDAHDILWYGPNNRWTGNYLCQNCFQKQSVQCPVCQRLVYKKHMAVSQYIDYPVCKDCAKDVLNKCSHCGKYISKQRSTSFGNHLVFCPECAENYICKCEICGKPFLKSFLTDVFKEETQEPQLCAECYDPINYHYYVQWLDFDRLRVREIRDWKFEKCSTKLLMSMLQTRHIFPEPEIKPYDVLLITTVEGQLVVVYAGNQILYHMKTNGSQTLTALKREGCMSFLMRTHFPVKYRKKLSDGRTFSIWDKPYELKCHTMANEDYGNIYYGGELVHEGSLYGETSKFLILGYIE